MLSFRRSCFDADFMCCEEGFNVSVDKFVIEVCPDFDDGSLRICSELFEGRHEGGGEIAEWIDQAQTGRFVNKHQAIFDVADGCCRSIADVHMPRVGIGNSRFDGRVCVFAS